MSDYDRAIKKESAGVYYEKLLAGAAGYQTDNLFAILAEAEKQHHDALVEMHGNIGPQKSQLKVLRGAACLFKTSSGKA